MASSPSSPAEANNNSLFRAAAIEGSTSRSNRRKRNHQITTQTLTLGRDDDNVRDHTTSDDLSYHNDADGAIMDEGEQKRGRWNISGGLSAFKDRIKSTVVPTSSRKNDDQLETLGGNNNNNGGGEAEDENENNHNHDVDSSYYASLDHPPEAAEGGGGTNSRGGVGPSSSSPQSRRRGKPKRHSSKTTARRLQESLLQSSSSSPPQQQSQSQQQAPLMIEEALQQDCAFFYQQQGPDSQSSSSTISISNDGPGQTRRTRTGGSRRDRRHHHHYSIPPPPTSSTNDNNEGDHNRNSTLLNSFGVFRTVQGPSAYYRGAEYSYGRDVVNVLSPPVLSRYKSKYEQLNAIYDNDSDADENDIIGDVGNGYYDLELQESSTDNGANSSRRSSSLLQNSSNLLYQHNGRMLLKLPHDQVRLVMDSDLPVGSLSVEQWRKDNENDNKSENGGNADNANDSQDQQPKLHYVLVVPDDLYCRLVGEMSDALTDTQCGFRQGGRMDIQVAIGVMSFVMFVLFINTIIWPTN